MYRSSSAACPFRRSALASKSEPTHGASDSSPPTPLCWRPARRPYRPPDIDFAHPRIFDSDTILDLDYTPQSMTIYGAGVDGLRIHFDVSQSGYARSI